MAQEETGVEDDGREPAPETGRRRLFDYPRAGRGPIRRWLPSFKHLLTLLLLVVSAVFTAVGVTYALTPVPDVVNADAFRQSNVWKWSDGSEITRTGSTNRQTVELSEVPIDVQHAVLSAEDRTFRSNEGVSLSGTFRALVQNLTGSGGDGLQGGSTITQQYVKNVYLTQEQTVARKFREALISIKLDRTESKDEILAGYLNTSYFGRGAYGIEAAAQAYYGVDIRRIDVAQGAYLAALLNAPSAYDVRNTTEAGRRAAIARWNYTLDGMVKEGWLPAERRAAMTFPQPIEPIPPADLAGVKGYLVEMAANDLIRRGVLDRERLDAGGYVITTTFDRRMTEALHKTVEDRMRTSLDPEERRADKWVRVAGASVEPSSGRIRAVYGGDDYVEQYINDATRRDVQVGSTFKPFVLTAALRDGVSNGSGRRVPVSPATEYDGNDDVVIHHPDGRPVTDGGAPWQPGNEDGRSYGRITLAQAMERSVNTVYAQLGMDTGPARVVDAAVDVGIPRDTPGLSPVASVALGTSTPSALDLASAYATFAAEGTWRELYAVDRLEHGDDEIRLPGRASRKALPEDTAATLTGVLRGVVEKGTAVRARELGRPAAGKTGTTDDNRSAWFVGYTPQLSTAVGMFREDPRTHAFLSLNGVAGMARVEGGSLPTMMWTTYMREALAGQPVKPFPKASDNVPGATSSPGASGTPASPGATTSGAPEGTTSAPEESPGEPSDQRGTTASSPADTAPRPTSGAATTGAPAGPTGRRGDVVPPKDGPFSP